MDDLKVSICRLCLKPENNYELLNETHKIHILYILPEINIFASNAPVICKTCAAFLQESYNFKTACVEIESYLENFVTPMKQLNLEEVISSKMFDEGKEQTLKANKRHHVCRLCLTRIEGNSFKEFGIIEENILQKCIPEMDLTLTDNPVSCENCMEYLQSQFNFVMKCQDIDELISNYLTRKSIDRCDLHEVLVFSQEKCMEDSYCLDENLGDMLEDKTFGNRTEIAFDNIDIQRIKEEPFGVNFMPVFSSTMGNDEGQIRSTNSSTPRVLHQCEVCSYITNRKYSLRIHMLTHKKTEEVTLYKCPECSHETKRKSNLLIHILKHKNPGDIRMHQCSECQYQTKLRSNLIKHELIHKPVEEITMHRCQNCPYQTKLKGNLIIHMIQHKNPEELIMHKCDECSYTTKLKNNLRKHILVHRNPEEVTMFKCQECDYQSKWKSHLIRHMVVHNSDEVILHKCDQCSYMAIHKYNLKKHLLTHKTPDEVTMHKCDLCEFQTKRKDRIKQHMNNMHNCSFCGYQTKDKKELNDHIESHEIPEEIYKCDMCTYEAKQKRYLQRHKKKNHSEVQPI